jgi:hypothetical protein
MFTSFRFAFVPMRTKRNRAPISLLSFETKAKRNHAKNESETKVARRNESTKAKRKRKCESETKVALRNERRNESESRMSHFFTRVFSLLRILLHGYW